jgi:hypothetical protein
MGEGEMETSTDSGISATPEAAGSTTTRPVVYQPTVRLSAADELRLLDQALEEARDRIASSAQPRLLEAPSTPATVPEWEADATPEPTNLQRVQPDVPVSLLPPEPHQGSGEQVSAAQGPAPDRRMLLAAIICVLQQELSRDG